MAVVVLALSSHVSYAATSIPGPADASRIEQREAAPPPEPSLLPPSEPMELFPSAQAPEESKRVVLTLQNVDVTGLTVFNPKDVQDIFAPYIGHSVTLDTVWLLAAQVTKRYHDAGYFLSRATIPQQKIENGTVHLHVIEGYIGDVKLQGSLADSRIVKQWIKRLKSYRPVTAAQIESVLLHLNDLPGVDLRAILEPMDTDASNEGSVRLALEQKPVQRISGSFNIDNYGSRFLGPYEGQVVVRAVTLPMQRTTLAGFSSLDWQEVKYGSLRHEVPLFAGATLEIYGSHTNAAPDHTLKPEDIRSNAYTLGASFDYSFIRQRQENLIGKVTLEGQNTESNILGAPLTRDYVRALRLSLNYQRADAWNGSNAFSSTLSQGLNFMGASQDGQRYISRAGAHPDFTKFNFDVSRLQALSDNWSLFGAGSSQVSSSPLYSSEQFGYGGQAFGRAYDNSEITGDNGVEGSAELRYNGFGPWYHLQPLPYSFYDIGAVWNLGHNQTTPYASGSSAGAGFRLATDFGISANFGLGFPLTRKIATPLVGNGKNPRYFMQLSYDY